METIKTWQERMDGLVINDSKRAIAARDAEIADLRAALSAQRGAAGGVREMLLKATEFNYTQVFKGSTKQEQREAFVNLILATQHPPAAATVEAGPCKECHGIGTHIGQHDGYDDADCHHCDGSGKEPATTTPQADEGRDAVAWLVEFEYLSGTVKRGPKLKVVKEYWGSVRFATCDKSEVCLPDDYAGVEVRNYKVTPLVFPTAPSQAVPGEVRPGALTNALWCDLKTDEERSKWLLLGRGYETGVIASSIQNEVAMAYHRLHLLAPTPPQAATVEAGPVQRSKH